MAGHKEPRLPLDLIRDISEIAAVDDLKSAKALVLVAKYMQYWWVINSALRRLLTSFDSQDRSHSL